MTRNESLPVQIGEVKIGHQGQTLNAILGSCIGLGFICPNKAVYGLAHALLPKSSGVMQKGSGRHVDEAIQSLLTKMDVQDDEKRKVKVFIAGGANMTKPVGTDSTHLVGTLNAESARKALRQAGLRIQHEDTGGECGRRVEIDCTTGDYTISKIPRLGASS